MDLRFKLVSLFMVVACVGLTLFATVSYTSSRELSIEKQTQLLQTLSEHILSSIDFSDTEQVTRHVFNSNEISDQSNYYFALLFRDNQVVFEQGDNAISSEVFSNLPLSIFNKRSNGIKSINHHQYIWVTVPSRNNPYALVYAQEIVESTLSQFLSHMGIPLALTIIVIVWIGVWSSISIASLFNKVSEQKKSLSYKAAHDNLTGLPNRTSLTQRIEESIAKFHNKGSRSIALCVLDLNHFKEINESLGHHCGDELLKQVGSRLPNILKTAACVARLGGDEFAIQFDNARPSSAHKLSEKIAHALEPAFEVDGHSLYVTATLGMAFYPTQADDASLLVQRAEMAMYSAKASNKHFALFDDKNARDSIGRLSIVHDLRTAIEENSLELYYQPKLNLQTNTIVGVEALVRWKNGNNGDIPTERIIYVAEKTGLIRPLTNWVLSTALKQCAEWRRRGIFLRLAVNLSASSLHDSKLEILINKLLTQENIPPQWLELEITETTMMSDPLQAEETLTRLDAWGIRLSIDDFGTGYSSLAYLKRLPVDEIKIDKSFVYNMTSHENDASIVIATIGLAHDLGLNVVAEGVEDQVAQDVLSSHGCDIAQGYHISKPLPARELDKILAPSKPFIIGHHHNKLPDDYSVIFKAKT